MQKMTIRNNEEDNHMACLPCVTDASCANISPTVWYSLLLSIENCFRLLIVADLLINIQRLYKTQFTLFQHGAYCYKYGMNIKSIYQNNEKWIDVIKV